MFERWINSRENSRRLGEAQLYMSYGSAIRFCREIFLKKHKDAALWRAFSKEFRTLFAPWDGKTHAGGKIKFDKLEAWMADDKNWMTASAFMAVGGEAAEESGIDFAFRQVFIIEVVPESIPEPANFNLRPKSYDEIELRIYSNFKSTDIDSTNAKSRVSWGDLRANKEFKQIGKIAMGQIADSGVWSSLIKTAMKGNSDFKNTVNLVAQQSKKLGAKLGGAGTLGWMARYAKLPD
jgi:hypothetical protein